MTPPSTLPLMMHPALHTPIMQTLHTPVMQDVGSPVGQQGVTLHLAQADAAAEFTALDRLLGELVVGTGRADLDMNGGRGERDEILSLQLVLHHVSHPCAPPGTLPHSLLFHPQSASPAGLPHLPHTWNLSDTMWRRRW